ncbi:MAG TPA: DUF2069 domain-containing protein [Solimonas sp.]
MRRPLSLYARAAALALHLALFISMLLTSTSLLGLVAAFVLLMPLPGLLRGREYTHAWASMLVAFYCALWLAEGWARPDVRDAAFLHATLAAFDFVSLVLYVRLRGRERIARTAASGAASH